MTLCSPYPAMCGIFCSFSHRDFLTPDSHIKRLLQNRGPDYACQHQIAVDTQSSRDDAVFNKTYATFFSTVLSLRGGTIVEQPLIDRRVTGSILSWNGEAWYINGDAIPGNDSKAVFSQLLGVCHGPVELSTRAIVDLFSSIQGPFAFVFYNAFHRRLYYARDCLGRRSLLKKTLQDGSLILSSVCDEPSSQTWAEIDADGIYVIDVEAASQAQSFHNAVCISYRSSNHNKNPTSFFNLPFPALNRLVSEQNDRTHTQAVDHLKHSLRKSLERRVHHIREAVPPGLSDDSEHQTRMAILFSGGLDCTILARMCHDLLPLHQKVDLLNVAFENPRIHKNLDSNESPYELCPDRITGRAAHAELAVICSGRAWQFVEINVPYTEAQAHREILVTLMHPHNTEMDLSISYALYFASRGKGFVRMLPDMLPESYSTPAHVLLSGLGADELFGGYQRHATAFARTGYAGLLDELELDFSRLGKRNLGRDDRVISDCSKEVRFPYLDEEFITLALELPVTIKCDFGASFVKDSLRPEEFLAPEKRILRLLAWQLDMKGAAKEKKRAIQFGARTAKMEAGKIKGTQSIS